MAAPDDAELLKLYLVGRDVPCPKCGYNLRGSVSGACSECGTELKLHVHPVIRLPRSYSAGILGLSTGLVLGAGVAFLGIAAGPVPLLGGTLAAVFSLVGLVLWDKLYYRTRRHRREAIAYLVWFSWLGAATALALLVSQVMRVLR